MAVGRVTPASLWRALRLVFAWQTGRGEVVESEDNVRRPEVVGTTINHLVDTHVKPRSIPVTVVRPRRTKGRRAKGHLPTWVILHGLARPGRHHPRLIRFSRALAATGAVVAIPEVPEWRSLALVPEVTTPTILAGLQALEAECLAGERIKEHNLVGGDPVHGTVGAEAPESSAPPSGVIGFSFGAPHAIAAAADERLFGKVSHVVSFGGYGDLRHTARYLFTGLHQHGEIKRRSTPDPYGRWIVAANFLTLVEEYHDAHDVAKALLELAKMGGDQGESYFPTYESTRSRLRQGLDPSRRDLFDLIAPAAGTVGDPVAGRELARRLVESALKVHPGLEPRDLLDRVNVPVLILHGWDDRLVPATQALWLRDMVGSEHKLASITRLLAHSDQDSLENRLALVSQLGPFVRTLALVLGKGSRGQQ